MATDRVLTSSALQLGLMEDDIVRINAGGTFFQASLSTLCQVPDSALASMLSGRWEQGLVRDDVGAVFLDVTPAVFELVLSHLRARRIRPEARLPVAAAPYHEELQAFLCFMGLEQEDASFTCKESPMTAARAPFSLVSVEGHFCGGFKHNRANAAVTYSSGTLLMEQILQGTLPDATHADKRAVYAWPTHCDHIFVLEFGHVVEVQGFRMMVARMNRCRWRVFADEDTEAALIWQQDMMSYVYKRELTLAFDRVVSAKSLRFVIDGLEADGDIGFYTFSFF
mmetsp:Transcript_14226/g.27607  ORF Transcript_14226/g.27607 Transcript_14226/m.27607 type:complete len:282 (+) Transcript_14226:45-890(+)